METERSQSEPNERKKGWENETKQRRDSVADFLRGHYRLGPDDREDYEDALRLSGGSEALLKSFIRGETPVAGVEVFYRKNAPEQVHAWVGAPGSMDFYLKDEALRHYLESLGES